MIISTNYCYLQPSVTHKKSHNIDQTRRTLFWKLHARNASFGQHSIMSTSEQRVKSNKNKFGHKRFTERDTEKMQALGNIPSCLHLNKDRNPTKTSLVTKGSQKGTQKIFWTKPRWWWFQYTPPNSVMGGERYKNKQITDRQRDISVGTCDFQRWLACSSRDQNSAR